MAILQSRFVDLKPEDDKSIVFINIYFDDGMNTKGKIKDRLKRLKSNDHCAFIKQDCSKFNRVLLAYLVKESDRVSWIDSWFVDFRAHVESKIQASVKAILFEWQRLKGHLTRMYIEDARISDTEHSAMIHYHRGKVNKTASRSKWTFAQELVYPGGALLRQCVIPQDDTAPDYPEDEFEEEED